MQRGIRYPAIPLRQQFLDAGHLQPVNGEPLVDLVGPGRQPLLSGRPRLPRTGAADACQAAELFLIRAGPVPGYPQRLRRHDVLAHRIFRQPRTQGYVAPAVSRLPAPDHFRYFHS